MKIEVAGARFGNKGAQLMLVTVCQALRNALPDVQLSVPLRDDAYEARAAYQLHITARRPSLRSRLPRMAVDTLASALAQTRLGATFGLIPEKDLDAIIDISGYGFGDKWPVSNAQGLMERARALQRRGKPTIMLPQMLGPFTKAGQAEAFQRLAQYVEIIYAREMESYEYARPLISRPDQLRLAPDITIATPARPISLDREPYVCLVPNSKLLEPNPQRQKWGDEYIDRLLRVGRHSVARGMAVKVVQHEYGPDDSRLVRELSSQLGPTECSVYTHADPQVLKGVLGGAQAVIGSRFHALVSALSMGTPAIALGWAHKYDALFRDFGVANLVHHVEDVPSQLLDLVDFALVNHDVLQADLLARKREFVKEIGLMWEAVFEVLGATADMTHVATESEARMRIRQGDVQAEGSS